MTNVFRNLLSAVITTAYEALMKREYWAYTHISDTSERQACS